MTVPSWYAVWFQAKARALFSRPCTMSPIMVRVMTMLPLLTPAATRKANMAVVVVLKAKPSVLTSTPASPSSITGRRPMWSLRRPQTMLVANCASE